MRAGELRELSGRFESLCSRQAPKEREAETRKMEIKRERERESESEASVRCTLARNERRTGRGRIDAECVQNRRIGNYMSDIAVSVPLSACRSFRTAKSEALALAGFRSPPPSDPLPRRGLPESL